MCRAATRATLAVVRGQASTEYIAVLLVAVALLATAAATADGGMIAGEVHRQMIRALCVVRDGDCQQDRAACVTSSRREQVDVGATIAVLHVQGRKVILREHRSDGTIAITQTELDGAGLQLVVGSGGHLSAEGMTLGLGGELSATFLGSLGRGRTWIVHDAVAADALVQRLRAGVPARLRGPGRGRHWWRRPPPLPEPDATLRSGVVQTAGDGSASGTSLTGMLNVSVQDTKGERVERATGRRTVYLERWQEGSGSVAFAGAGGRFGGTAIERYAVTFDRAGRPIDLAVLATGSYAVSAQLPRPLQSLAGMLGSPTTDRRQWSEESHLDLTDPESLAVARAFLGAITGGSVVHRGRLVHVTKALADRIDAAGVVHARTYSSRSSSVGAGGRIGAGVGIGFDANATTTTNRLVGATTRGIDGVWRGRVDCFRAA